MGCIQSKKDKKNISISIGMRKKIECSTKKEMNVTKLDGKKSTKN